MQLKTQESKLAEKIIWDNTKSMGPMTPDLVRSIHNGHNLDFYESLVLEFRFNERTLIPNYGMNVEIRMIGKDERGSYSIQPHRSNLKCKGLKLLFGSIWKGVSKKDIGVLALQAAENYHSRNWNFPEKRVNVAEGSNDPEWVEDKEKQDAFNHFYSQIQKGKIKVDVSPNYLGHIVFAK